jgi:hypothetical protein
LNGGSSVQLVSANMSLESFFGRSWSLWVSILPSLSETARSKIVLSHDSTNGSWITLSQCVLDGNDASYALVTGTANPSDAVEDGIFHVGCNDWNGAAFPSSGAAAATKAIVVAGSEKLVVFETMSDAGNNRSRISPSGQQCSGRRVVMWTTTQTVDPGGLPRAPPTPDDTIPFLTSSAGALLFVSFTSPVDGAALVAFGQSACAPQSMQRSTSAAQVLLSPFYALRVPLVCVYGNVVMCAMAALLHTAVVRLVASRRRRGDGTPVTNIADPSIPTPLLFDTMNSRKPSEAMMAAATLRYPNLSILLLIMASKGIAFYTGQALSQAISDSDSRIGSICGVLGIVAIISVSLVFWRRSTNARLVDQMRFCYVLRSSRTGRLIATMGLPRWVTNWWMPQGQWFPSSIRNCVGRMRGAVVPGCEHLAMLPQLLGVLTSFVLGLGPFHEATWWCTTQAAILAVVLLCGGAVVMVKRPFRVKGVGLLFCMMWAAQVVMYIASAAAAQSDDNTASVMVAWAGGLYSFISIVKMGHTAFLWWWERRLRCSQEHHEQTKHQRHTIDTVANSERLVKLAGRRRKEVVTATRAAANLRVVIRLACNQRRRRGGDDHDDISNDNW